MIREKLIFKIFVEAPVETCPIEALDFISAHETATGVSMDQIQKDGICGFVDRLKGNGTTNGTDLWTIFTNADAKIFPLAPSSDLVSSADACRMELITQTQRGTYINFVAGDFQPNGVTGGSTKIFRCGNAPTDYPADDLGFGAYVVNRINVSSVALCGVDAASGSNVQAIFDRTLLTESAARVQDLDGTQITAARPTTGMYYVQRSGTTKEHYVDNTQLFSVTSSFTTVRTSVEMGFHAFNRANTTLIESLSTLGMYVYGAPYLSSTEYADFIESITWYQQNIITGGR